MIFYQQELFEVFDVETLKDSPKKLLVYMIFESSKTNEDSLSTTNLIPFADSTISSSCCSSRTTPNIGPPQPKPFISNLTEDLPFFSRCCIKAFFVISLKEIFIHLTSLYPLGVYNNIIICVIYYYVKLNIKI
ncbi:MAG: hypothetical protein ACI8WT_002359 [Clostridium sp.]